MRDREKVWVIDASALINTKKAIANDRQWEFLEGLKAMVERGELCFPKAVRNELAEARHVDAPEAWALGVAGSVRHAYEPDVSTVARVMQVAGDVVDVDAEKEVADPYVLAQALDIAEKDLDVCIVTDDVIDRVRLKIAMSTACDRLNLQHCTLLEFMEAIGFDPKAGWRP